MKAAYYRVATKTNNEWAWVCSYRLLLLMLLCRTVDPPVRHYDTRWIARSHSLFSTHLHRTARCLHVCNKTDSGAHYKENETT